MRLVVLGFVISELIVGTSCGLFDSFNNDQKRKKSNNRYEGSGNDVNPGNNHRDSYGNNHKNSYGNNNANRNKNKNRNSNKKSTFSSSFFGNDPSSSHDEYYDYNEAQTKQKTKISKNIKMKQSPQGDYQHFIPSTGPGISNDLLIIGNYKISKMAWLGCGNSRFKFKASCGFKSFSIKIAVNNGNPFKQKLYNNQSNCEIHKKSPYFSLHRDLDCCGDGCESLFNENSSGFSGEIKNAYGVNYTEFTKSVTFKNLRMNTVYKIRVDDMEYYASCESDNSFFGPLEGVMTRSGLHIKRNIVEGFKYSNDERKLCQSQALLHQSSRSDECTEMIMNENKLWGLTREFKTDNLYHDWVYLLIFLVACLIATIFIIKNAAKVREQRNVARMFRYGTDGALELVSHRVAHSSSRQN